MSSSNDESKEKAFQSENTYLINTYLTLRIFTIYFIKEIKNVAKYKRWTVNISADKYLGGLKTQADT